MAAMKLCDLCLSFSGLYSNWNSCCTTRWLANLPREKRRKRYEQILECHGPESLAATKLLVKAEYERHVAAGKEKK